MGIQLVSHRISLCGFQTRLRLEALHVRRVPNELRTPGGSRHLHIVKFASCFLERMVIFFGGVGRVKQVEVLKKTWKLSC